MTVPKMPDYAGHWWNVGYLEGEQERVALATACDALRHRVCELLAELDSLRDISGRSGIAARKDAT